MEEDPGPETQSPGPLSTTGDTAEEMARASSDMVARCQQGVRLAAACEDVDPALEVTAKGDVDQRLRTMSTFILSIVSDRFGIKKQHATKITAPIPKRRQIKISQLCKKPRALRSQYRKASDEEKAALAELRCVVRERLISPR